MRTSTPKAVKVLLKVTETFLSSLSTIRKLLSQRNVLCAQHSDGKFPLLRKLKSSFDVTNPEVTAALGTSCMLQTLKRTEAVHAEEPGRNHRTRHSRIRSINWRQHEEGQE